MRYVPHIAAFLILILAGIFLFAAFSKLLDWENTILALQKLGFKSYFSIIVGAILVFYEIMLGLAFLNSKLIKNAAILSIITLIIFSLIVFWGQKIGIITTCQCFGRLFDAKIGKAFYLRNGIIISIAMLLIFYIKNYSLIINPINTRIFKVLIYSLILINFLLGGKTLIHLI